MPGEQGPSGNRGIPGDQVRRYKMYFLRNYFIIIFMQGPPGPKGRRGENKELAKVASVAT